MTEQLNPEQILPTFPEDEQLIQIEPPHRLRKFIARSAIVACGVLGAATSMVALQPDAERTVGPVSLDAHVVFADDIEVLGLPAADSSFGIGMNVGVKVPDLDELPQISRRLAPITQQIASKDNHDTVLNLVKKEYTPEINSMKNELIRESLLYMGMGALAGSFLAAKVLERFGQDRQSWRFITTSSLIGILIISGAEYQSLGSIDAEQSANRLSHELQRPFDEYLLTSTSDMLVNLDTINEETSKQIARIVKISSALTQKPPETPQKAQTWVIYSDAHELPTAPATIETLAQSSNADALLGLGDYGNTGSEFEMDLLNGLKVDATSFIGYDDIRTCKTWNNVKDVCAQRGIPYLHGALSGNHDPASIIDIFKNLGMIDLDQSRQFNTVPIIALSDACFVDSEGCRGDDTKTKNQQYAKDQLIRLEASGDPMPKIGFFASYDAAEEFVGKIDTLIVGGKHKFSHDSRDGSEIYYIGTVGQAFPRGAKEAGALLISLLPDGQLVQCNNVTWQTLQTSGPKIEPC